MSESDDLTLSGAVQAKIDRLLKDIHTDPRAVEEAISLPMDEFEAFVIQLNSKMDAANGHDRWI